MTFVSACTADPGDDWFEGSPEQATYLTHLYEWYFPNFPPGVEIHPMDEIQLPPRHKITDEIVS